MAETETKTPQEGESAPGWFSRVRNSIRTQYALATAFFLILILSVFYVGGRIVLVHLVRETEDQVRNVGTNVSRLAYRNAEKLKVSQAAHVAPIAARLKGADPSATLDAATLLSDGGSDVGEVSLLAAWTPDRKFLSAAQRASGGVKPLEAIDFAAYESSLARWLADGTDALDRAPVGIMHLNGVSHYVLFVYDEETQLHLVIGTPFDLDAFTAQVSEGFGSYNIRLERTGSKTARSAHGEGQSKEQRTFGFSSMFSDALNYYSGGFWTVGNDPFEAVFTVRDVAGNTITTIYISLPTTFSSVTGMALERFTFFIAIIGIMIILPLFWLQGRVLLNPLSRMTEDIQRLSVQHDEVDCPRLVWEGRDEFANLAESVNRMLETISARTMSLNQLRMRQRALIEGVPDALAIFDAKGRLIDITKQAEGVAPLPGFRLNETLDGAVFGPAGVAAFRAELEQVFAASRMGRVRLEDGAFTASDEKKRQFEMRLTRMDDHFALAIVRDVTKELTERRLREAAEQRALDFLKRESLTLLAAGIAHDVNNILTVILSTAEGALTARGDEEAARVVREAVKRGQAMTRELMTYAGQSKVTLQRATAEMVVKDVMTLAERMVPSNVTISTSLSAKVPDVDVDPNQFWKVFFNIVKNAGEAIGDRRGVITISTVPFEMTAAEASTFTSEAPLPPGPGVIFRIADNGPGIRPDLLPRLFDPYVSSKATGRGLGLATVRTIVEAHGGGIRVTSATGRGTTFHIFLPESHLAETVVPAAPSATGEVPSAVLLVDDDELVLKTTSILLKALKTTVHVARDRKSALAFLHRRASEIGAIILDAHLKGADAVRLLEAFRLAAPKVKVILSTGSREEEMRALFAAHPYDVFLGKPYTLEELKQALMK